jgi:hypothetical protein
VNLKSKFTGKSREPGSHKFDPHKLGTHKLGSHKLGSRSFFVNSIYKKKYKISIFLLT